MVKKIVVSVLVAMAVTSGCSKALPSCNDENIRQSRLNMIRDAVLGNDSDSRFFVDIAIEDIEDKGRKNLERICRVNSTYKINNVISRSSLDQATINYGFRISSNDLKPEFVVTMDDLVIYDIRRLNDLARVKSDKNK